VGLVMLQKGDLDGASTLVMEFVLNLTNGVEDIRKESSNYREFRNLVNALLRGTVEARLKGAEIFLFTHNQVA
jgi:hypothetical protein